MIDFLMLKTLFWKTLDWARKGGNRAPSFFSCEHSLSCNRQFIPTNCYVCNYFPSTDNKLLCIQIHKNVLEYTKVYSNTQKCIRIHKSVFEYTFVYSNTLLCIVTSYCNKLHAVIARDFSRRETPRENSSQETPRERLLA